MYALFVSLLFFFNDTATTEIYTLSLHDALPISTPKIKKVTPDEGRTGDKVTIAGEHFGEPGCVSMVSFGPGGAAKFTRSEEHTSELQSQSNLVCRLLLEKKKKKNKKRKKIKAEC